MLFWRHRLLVRKHAAPVNIQVDTGVDYYDVTTIDGVNLPVEMKPNPRSKPLERDDDCKYYPESIALAMFATTVCYHRNILMVPPLRSPRVVACPEVKFIFCSNKCDLSSRALRCEQDSL